MNLLQGRVDGSVVGLGPVFVRVSRLGNLSGSITVGIRAEDLHLANGGSEVSLPFSVDFVEELGAHRLVHGLLGDQALTAVLPLNAEIRGEMILTVFPDKLHFFGEDSRRLEVDEQRPVSAMAPPAPQFALAE